MLSSNFGKTVASNRLCEKLGNQRVSKTSPTHPPHPPLPVCLLVLYVSLMCRETLQDFRGQISTPSAQRLRWGRSETWGAASAASGCRTCRRWRHGTSPKLASPCVPAWGPKRSLTISSGTRSSGPSSGRDAPSFQPVPHHRLPAA